LKILPKKLSLSSQKYRFGIRDPRSGIRKKPIPDPGVKKAPDPGSATLDKTLAFYDPQGVTFIPDFAPADGFVWPGPTVRTIVFAAGVHEQAARKRI
jgi:hypothetical protein